MNDPVDRTLVESLKTICEEYLDNQHDDMTFRALLMGHANIIAGISADESKAMLDTLHGHRIIEKIKDLPTINTGGE